jgi:T-complex protein 1 subunit beta
MKGKTALAIEAFARALRQLPHIIADNGGYDSAELVQNLKVEIEKGNSTMGLNLFDGRVDCMKTLGITVNNYIYYFIYLFFYIYFTYF